MEIKNLRTFCKVVECNSFSGAAKELNIAQSTVTYQIQALEAELNVLLFEQFGNSIQLTNDGETLYRYSQEAIAKEEEFKYRLSGETAQNSTIRIGAEAMAAKWVLPKVLAAFREKFPIVSIKIHIREKKELLESLQRGRYDVILISRDKNEDKKLQILGSLEYSLGLFCSRDSGLAGRTVKREQLSEIPVALPSDQSGQVIRQFFGETLQNVLLESESYDIIKEYVERDLCVGLLPQQVFLQDANVRSVKVTGLTLPSLYLQLAASRNKWIGRELEIFAGTFITVVNQHLKNN